MEQSTDNLSGEIMHNKIYVAAVWVNVDGNSLLKKKKKVIDLLSLCKLLKLNMMITGYQCCFELKIIFMFLYILPLKFSTFHGKQNL